MIDDPILEGRATAEAFNGPAGEGFKNAGRLNAYQCRTCGHYVITIDREPGVTPFLTKCGHCLGEAESAGYRVGPHYLPTHEWVRPESLDGLSPWTIDHIRSGGLIMRPISASAPDWTAAPVRLA